MAVPVVFRFRCWWNVSGDPFPGRIYSPFDSPSVMVGAMMVVLVDQEHITSSPNTSPVSYSGGWNYHLLSRRWGGGASVVQRCWWSQITHKETMAGRGMLALPHRN